MRRRDTDKLRSLHSGGSLAWENFGSRNIRLAIKRPRPLLDPVVMMAQDMTYLEKCKSMDMGKRGTSSSGGSKMDMSLVGNMKMDRSTWKALSTLVDAAPRTAK